MVSSYRMLEHPADIGFEAKGKDLADAIESASYALYKVMVESENINSTIIKNISVSAIDKEAVIVKWLNEIVFIFDSESFIANKVKIVIYENYEEISIQGKIFGELFDPLKHRFKVHVKAVTYHQFELLETKDETTIKVFLDI